jgi:hypothetical protein
MRALCMVALVAAEASAGPVDSLAPGHWYEVPGSHLAALDPCPARTCSYSGAEGVHAMVDDWSGGAFDTTRDRLIIWGGGHGGYGGNEVYVFDLGTLAWQRLSAPSDPPAVDVAYAPNGGPASRHTYNYVQYVPPPVDRFCSFGGAGFFTSGQTGTPHVDCFDFGTDTWETGRFADTACSNLIGATTAVDPVTGHVWQHGGNQSWQSELDPATNTWTQHGDQFNDVYMDYYKTAAIDPVARQYVSVGQGQVLAWGLGAGTLTGVELTTMGATEIVAAASPGFEYDAAAGVFVAWMSGGDVFTFDLPSKLWTRLPPAADNTVVPTAPNGNGTFGRFRYSPQHDVFVLVNSADENVFIYRLAHDGGVTTPFDAGVADAGVADAGAPDAGDTDAGTGEPDAGGPNAGAQDAGAVDAGARDAGGSAVDAGHDDDAPMIGVCGCSSSPAAFALSALLALARRRGRGCAR